MKKSFLPILISCIIFGGLSLPTIEAEANTKVNAIAYKNCTELNKVYKGGVAKDAKVKNVGGKTKYAPFVSAELYNLNKKSDRDKDGIACER